MANLKRLGLLLWYGLGLYLGLIYAQGPLLRAWEALGGRDGAGGWVDMAKALLGLGVLVGGFVLLHLAARAVPAWAARGAGGQAPPPAPAPRPAPPGLAFPSPITVIVGVWLLFIAAFNIGGLILTLSPPDWLTDTFPSLAIPVDGERAAGERPGPEEDVDAPGQPDEALGQPDDAPGQPDEAPGRPVRDLIVTLLAAGVGSTITAMMGYLEHASIRKDFDPAFAPWYVARPILGLLLGALFYFVLKGGLLATVSGADETGSLPLNEYALAGLGGLVGLFSKNALEKLREVFNIFFATHGQVAGEVTADLAKRLPPELWQQVQEHLQPSEGGDGDDGGDGRTPGDESGSK